MEKYVDYPKDEELIFADCLIMAKYLIDGEKLKAKKEVGRFLGHLKSFTRHIVFNPRRKVYSPEFDFLRCGKTEVCRMFMFSQKNVHELLISFGLSMVRNNDAEAFTAIKQIGDIVKEYGEPKGRFHRSLSIIENYPHASPLILSSIILIIAIIYYLLSGQALPFKP
jgi:hypothetical protein